MKGETNMKAKRLLTLLLALAMTTGLVACGGGGGKADQALVISLAEEPATLDPSRCNDAVGDAILINTMEPLIRIEENENGENVPTGAGAERWESNEDGSVWTFYLRDNNWSDGQAVTAQDYVYGIQRILDPQVGSPISFLLSDCIKNANAVTTGEMPVSELGVKALDDKTLEITLEGPTPYFLSLAYSKAMYPARQDIAESLGDTYGADASGLVFNGPFVVTQWTHNSQIMLEKNDSYWDKEHVGLDSITYMIMGDENSRYNSFENGSLEIVTVGQPEWIDRFNQKDDVTFTEYVTPSIRFHFYNTQDPIFQNEKIRKAFTLALDRDDVVDTIYHGTMLASYSWVPQGVASGETIPDYSARGTAPLTTLIEENPDAKALLVEGMEELGLGSDPATLDITFSFGGTTQWLRNYGEYLQAVYKEALGVEIQLEFNEWGTFQSLINSGDYQVGYQVWSIDYNDPMAMLSLFTTGSSAIPTGWSNEEYDALVAEAGREMDDEARLALYQQAENILVHDAGVVCPVVNETVNRFNYNYIQNLPTNYFSSNNGGMKYVSIQQDS